MTLPFDLPLAEPTAMSLSKVALAAVIAATTVLFVPSAALAEGNESTRPFFQLPFACGMSVEMSTGPTHDDYDSGVWRRPRALDMYDPPAAGTAVRAAAAGTVQYLSGSSTNTLYVNHGNGWRTQYSHMSGRIANGSTVSRGQQIGVVDNVGTGVEHLHLEQQYNGVPVYPKFNGKEYRLSEGGNAWAVTRVSHNCSAASPTQYCTYTVNTQHYKRSWAGTQFETEGSVYAGNVVMAGTDGTVTLGGVTWRRLSAAGGADRRGPFVRSAYVTRSSGGCISA